jgi:anaerobic magnesium-protoporphyrin IX monomethyl ester cyclase
MLRIQLAHSYYLRFDPKQWERGKPYPPLATLQVAAMLRNLGHEVTLFDAMLATGVEAHAAEVRDAHPDLVVLYEDNFNFLTKMCLERMREAACAMVASARASGARVLVAGSDASDRPGALLDAGAHAVLRGEGIAALLHLVERLDREPFVPAEAWVDGVPGIALSTTDAEPSLPAAQAPDARLSGEAAWDLVDIERYRRFWMERHGTFSLNMVASRGCPFRCNWCAKPIWGNHYAQRGARDVAMEMAFLKQRFRPDHMWMADDIFGFRVDWLKAFADELAARDGSVPFTIQIRANMVNDAMAAALAAAGCVEAWIGAESGSQRVLDAMRKDTAVAEIEAARERLRRHGIRVGFFIQLGYLGERLDDLRATRDLVSRAAPDDIGVSVSYPLPGTRFHAQVQAQLGRKTRWRDSGELAMMFHGAYDSAFYREIRDLLHQQVALQQAAPRMDPRAHGRARGVLECRWQALLARESRHRNADALTAVPEGRAALEELHVAAAQDG